MWCEVLLLKERSYFYHVETEKWWSFIRQPGIIHSDSPAASTGLYLAYHLDHWDFPFDQQLIDFTAQTNITYKAIFSLAGLYCRDGAIVMFFAATLIRMGDNWFSGLLFFVK